MNMHDVKEGYLKTIDRTKGNGAKQALWLREMRLAASERFAEIGFPSTREEEWKYTDVTPILLHDFQPASAGAFGLKPVQLQEFWFADLPAHRIAFVNGHYSDSLSRPGVWPKGVQVMPMARAMREPRDWLESYFGECQTSMSHGFAALNTALFEDGLYIHMDSGTQLDKPIHLLYLSTGAEDGFLSTPRNLLIMEEGSKLQLIEQYAPLAATSYFTNAITEIVVGPNAAMEHYRLQQEASKAFHISGTHLRLDLDARYRIHNLDLGGRLVRNDLHTRLDAEGAQCQLNGLYVLDGRQHLDNHTHIDHARPYGTSGEFYKGVLDGRARSVFHGRVVVAPDAQHSNAKQVNNNLLLSRDAEADSQPQLEIYADDVKCSHGATVGQLDPDAFFYLRSRAIDENSARNLLTYAFAKDVLGRMDLAPVRLLLERHLATKLEVTALHPTREVIH